MCWNASEAHMPKNDLMQQFGKYYSVVFLVPAAVLIGFVMGYFLDKLFHTGFLKIVFLFLGLASGMIELVRELTKDDARG
jgi:F0F1-type ATP synthase assembly protein I